MKSHIIVKSVGVCSVTRLHWLDIDAYICVNKGKASYRHRVMHYKVMTAELAPDIRASVLPIPPTITLVGVALKHQARIHIRFQHPSQVHENKYIIVNISRMLTISILYRELMHTQSLADITCLLLLSAAWTIWVGSC